MKKSLLILGAAALLAAPQVVDAEGFAVNEWSAEGVAMGGARMFAEGDAANLAYNPASITKIENKANKIVATYISPHGEYTAFPKDTTTNGGLPAGVEEGKNRVHPAWIPGQYYVKRISDNEWFGIGTVTRFGLVSQFPNNSMVSTNSSSAKMAGMSMIPTYARKLDDKWSVAVGAEINYVGLQLDKDLVLPKNMKNVLGGMAAGKPVAPEFDLQGPRVNMQIEGDSYALGWNAAANYKFDEKNEMGIVYRSKIEHSMNANTRFKTMGMRGTADGYGTVTLPDSLAIGYSHKFDDKTRVELNGTYTKWSSYDRLDMTFSNITLPGALAGMLPPGTKLPDSVTVPSYKGWDNGWRCAIGVEHKLSDKYSLLAGYAYDEASISTEGADFMVPTGDRITYSLGGQYHDEKVTVALAAAYMKVGELTIPGTSLDPFDHAHSHDSYTKIYSISYQYNF